MRSQPDQSAWASRFEEALKARALTIWLRCGLFDEFGPLNEHFTGYAEGYELIKEIAGFLVSAWWHELCARQAGRGVGRPHDVRIRHLARAVCCYVRFHERAGRHSVLTSVDGKLVQKESGPLFEFFKVILAPLNDYLTELGRKPISAARVARYALDHRYDGM